MPKPACTFTAACKAGVALNLATPLTALDWVLNEADLVLLLATNPGFSGQKHLPATAAKTARLCEMLVSAGSAAVIMVDGGIKRKILPGLVEAGAAPLWLATRSSNILKALLQVFDRCAIFDL